MVYVVPKIQSSPTILVNSFHEFSLIITESFPIHLVEFRPPTIREPNKCAKNASDRIIDRKPVIRLTRSRLLTARMCRPTGTDDGYHCRSSRVGTVYVGGDNLGTLMVA